MNWCPSLPSSSISWSASPVRQAEPSRVTRWLPFFTSAKPVRSNARSTFTSVTFERNFTRRKSLSSTLSGAQATFSPQENRVNRRTASDAIRLREDPRVVFPHAAGIDDAVFSGQPPDRDEPRDQRRLPASSDAGTSGSQRGLGGGRPR